MLQVTINGQARQFPEGLTINQALKQIAVEVPTLCHDDRLVPYGSCRLCTVEVKGVNGLVTAVKSDGRVADSFPGICCWACTNSGFVDGIGGAGGGKSVGVVSPDGIDPRFVVVPSSGPLCPSGGNSRLPALSVETAKNS